MFEFDAEKHEYRVDGVIYPSVTQILSGLGMLPDYSKLDPFYRERGTAVHACIKMHLQGDEIDWDFEMSEEVKPRFERFLWLEEEYGLFPAMIEVPMYSSTFGYAGTPDLYSWSTKLNRSLIVDYKGDAREPGHDLQIEGYSQLLWEAGDRVQVNGDIRAVAFSCPAFIVTLGGTGPRPGVHPIDRSLNNRELFLAAAAVYNWRTQNVRRPKNGIVVSGA